MGLEDSNRYTGNCFRNTSIAVAVETGLTLEDVQDKAGFQLTLKKLKQPEESEKKRKLDEDLANSWSKKLKVLKDQPYPTFVMDKWKLKK